MNQPNGKSSSDAKRRLDFDEVTLDKNPGTYERNLIAALIHSQKLFLATNGRLCPWDSIRSTRRPDFSVNHYNVLYEAISSFWSPMGTTEVRKEPIPQSQLKAILIDWNNSGRVATATIQKILDEIDEDLYKMDLTEGIIEHGIMGKAFNHWLSTRLAKRLAAEISDKSKKTGLRLEDCQAVIDHYRSVQLETESGIGAASLPQDRNMYELSASVGDVEKDPDELLKSRYLGRGGGLLLVGPTGIGKSTIAMQCSVQWALGKAAFEIEPKDNLKSLIIQAENDDVDMVEMFNGVCEALEIKDTERENTGKNIIVAREDATAGSDFFLKVVRPMVEKHKPQLLWIDPALAFLGGESNSQKDVGNFLRTLLNPLIREFKCGAIVLHHTNKPPSGKDVSSWSNSDFAYAGGGSAEWANWARAVLVVKPIRGSPIFELMAAKRGGRIGWKAPDGQTKAYSRYIAHSKVKGQLYWRDADPGEIPGAGDPKETDERIVLDLVPTAEGETIEKKQLLKDCDDNSLKDKKARAAIKRLIAAKKLQEVLIRGKSGRPGACIARVPQQPPPSAAGTPPEEPAGKKE
jgi:hypothetical protein